MLLTGENIVEFELGHSVQLHQQAEDACDHGVGRSKHLHGGDWLSSESAQMG